VSAIAAGEQCMPAKLSPPYFNQVLLGGVDAGCPGMIEVDSGCGRSHVALVNAFVCAADWGSGNVSAERGRLLIGIVSSVRSNSIKSY